MCFLKIGKGDVIFTKVCFICLKKLIVEQNNFYYILFNLVLLGKKQIKCKKKKEHKLYIVRI